MKCKNSMVLVLPLILLASCSSSKDGAAGGSANTVLSSISGEFIDAPVVGLNYSSASNSGVTGTSGSFNCALGEEVTFTLGTNLVIGKASCGKKIFLDNLDSRANKTKIGAVLQSFGIVGGTITIPTAVRTAAPPAIDFAAAVDGNITTFVTSLNSTHGLGLTAVTIANATTHLNQSLEDNIKFSTSLKAALDEIAWFKSGDGGSDIGRYDANQDVHIEKNQGTDCEINFYLSLYKKLVGQIETYNVYAYTATPHTALNGVDGERVTGDVFSSKFSVTESGVTYAGNFSAYLDIANTKVKGKMTYTVSNGQDSTKCSATINEVVKVE